MADMFSDEWMKSFMEQWNAEGDLSGALAQIGFNSVIAYGYEGEDQPRGVLTVVNGKAEDAGAFTGQTLNWDIRCKQAQWEKMIAKPPGMMGLGTAFATGKDPRMAGPFIKSFSVMGRA